MEQTKRTKTEPTREEIDKSYERINYEDLPEDIWFIIFSYKIPEDYEIWAACLGKKGKHRLDCWRRAVYDPDFYDWQNNLARRQRFTLFEISSWVDHYIVQEQKRKVWVQLKSVGINKAHYLRITLLRKKELGQEKLHKWLYRGFANHHVGAGLPAKFGEMIHTTEWNLAKMYTIKDH